MSFLYNYLLFDAARADESLPIAQELNPEYKCLYLVKPYDELLTVAPYLFSITPKTPFWEWYSVQGWNQNWGVLLFSNSLFEHVVTHFRRFLMVKNEDDQQLYFRFYDPRVLKIFLPTCDEKQIIEFFGPIYSYIVEGETKEEAIRFWHQDGILKQEILPVEKVFGNVI